ERALGEGFRGRGLAPPDKRLVGATLAGAKLGQVLLVVLLVLLPPRVEHGPPRLKDPHPFGAKRHAIPYAGATPHLLQASKVEDGDESDDDGVVDLLLIWRERPGWLACRDNGVVVTHLLFVDDSPGEGEGTEVEFSDLGRFERPELVQGPKYLSLQIA